LSADPNNLVVLIETGPKDHWWDWRIHMPGALMYNLCHDKYNWYRFYFSNFASILNNQTSQKISRKFLLNVMHAQIVEKFRQKNYTTLRNKQTRNKTV
jgi:hypothetical protein